MTVHYTEGPARAVIRGETVVVLPDKADDTLLTDLWTELAGVSDGVAAALGVLTSVPGGLRAVPPFAVVSVQSTGAAHVAVRGSGVEVTVATAGGPVQVTGQDVVSWSERVIEDPASFVVGLAASGTGPGASPSDGGLPVESAVVPAASVRRALTADAEAGSTSGAPATAPPVSGEPDAASVFAKIPGVGGAPATPPVPPPPPAEPVGSPGDGPGPSFAAPAAPVSDSPVPEATQVGGDGEDEYEHLFGETIMRSVEDAAVRVSEEDDEEEGEGSAAPGPASSVPVVDPAPAPAEPAGAHAASGPADGAGEAWEAPSLISEIPGSFPGASSPATTDGTPAAAHRAAAVDEVEEPDDHDGHTVMQSDLAALRRPGGPASSPTPAVESQPISGGVQILAVTCPNGHANPPARPTCRTCGEALSGEPSTAARPPLGRLVVTTGSAQAGAAGARGEQIIQLDRSVIVGRRPRTSTTSASEIPRLVTVSSPNQDISRSHLEISLEEWHVLVADMATTNGTTLIRPGQPPRRLHPNEKEIVADGDVVDLGDGVTLKFEGIW
ncbi:FHA domain-containing protein [Myceligenerans pegani]|uniref:FHA domain-containing protein n=1 Tax=Myceligenerans pegani TaxID=2776917 RepID=A0ABR9N5D0_9MICO|nr:FHA domain-containing protein [Myceligenerans sp. TRM 65318]MBE1878877.1 FHA domain-containing protein [Myceligenerans sp. TRM 65318]MBE3021148.1 FHA domain-containing protein [Myceligenerans sp. TRM 65318]